jgi:MFS family permease
MIIPTYFCDCMTHHSDTTPHLQASEPQATKDVTWDGPNDPENPKNLASSRKWLAVAVLASGSTSVTCASSIYTTTYTQMNQEFGNTEIVGELGLSLFVLGLGVSPMILGPLSENYGRRTIYILFYILFAIWLIPCAVAPNIQTMLIARFLDGTSGSAFLSIAGGTISDIFAKEELQGPMTIYSTSLFLGPCRNAPCVQVTLHKLIYVRYWPNNRWIHQQLRGMEVDLLYAPHLV